MAIRIPVVISQHERRAGSVADYEEQLITRIVMENGLDATLIADLKSIHLDTTDHLCIEGLKGDFALATWESAEYVCQHLHRLGIPALELVPVDGGPRLNSGDPAILAKKIFVIPLATNVSIDATIKTLKDLLLSRSTPVFSIGATTQRKLQSVASLPLVKSQMPLMPVPLVSELDLPKSIASVVNTSDPDFPNIDQLMSDLDQFEM